MVQHASAPSTVRTKSHKLRHSSRDCPIALRLLRLKVYNKGVTGWYFMGVCERRVLLCLSERSSSCPSVLILSCTSPSMPTFALFVCLFVLIHKSYWMKAPNDFMLFSSGKTFYFQIRLEAWELEAGDGGGCQNFTSIKMSKSPKLILIVSRA